MNSLDFNTLLDLPDTVVEKTELNKEHEFLVHVKSTQEGTTCHCCGQHTNKPYGFDKEQRIRHLSVFGYPCYIVIKLPRYQCRCKKKIVTTTQRLSWRTKNSSYTTAFEKHILLSLINSTIEDISTKESLGYGAIEGIIERNTAGEVDWDGITDLNLMGIDEISLRKGHKDFVTLVTTRDDEGNIRILAVLSDRWKATIKKFSQYSRTLT